MTERHVQIDSDLQALVVVVAVRDLAAELDFFVEEAGFGIDAVFPADDPTIAVVSRAGLAVRLERADADAPVRVRAVGTGEPATLRSPGGTTIEVASPVVDVVVPDAVPAVVVTPSEGPWVTGRAGMRYRDLLPGRWGGRFVASHIHIPVGGPVPDYVHYHRIRFQLIVVKAGWVEVVYEDQGEPFVLHPGDAVLQPPEIRHRVLRSSGDLEVIEVGCPADHMTLADRELELPTPVVRPDRRFGGQRFARSALDSTAPSAAPLAGYRSFSTGFGEATGGIADASILEPDGTTAAGTLAAGPGLTLAVVLRGAVTVSVDDAPATRLDDGGSVALPGGTRLGLRESTPDLRLLLVTAPTD